MQKKILLLLLTLLVVLGCSKAPAQEINSFEECVNAGNPVMESYPRQCNANGQTFIEEITEEISFHECTEEEKKNEACTLQYDPVCGIVDNGIKCVTTPCASTDAETYGNGCAACSNDAYQYYPGTCEDQTFVICGEEVKTGFDPAEFAEQNNGICVDICPGNYDPYVTQIGVSICIEHYGIEEIEAWEVCTKSSESCNCVKAYETTSEETIEDAEYRCVPEKYAERLLFRSGVDRLDEEGKSSVMIA